MTALGRTFRHTLVYGLGVAANRGAAFVLVPIVNHMMAPEDVGVYVLCSNAALFLLPLFEFGMNSAAGRFYFDYIDDDHGRDVFRTSTVFLAVHTLVLSAGMFLLHRPLAARTLGEGVPAGLLVLAAAQAAFMALNNQPLTLFRMREQSGRYLVVNLVRAVAGPLLAIVLIQSLEFAPVGALGGDVITYGTMAFVGFFLIRAHLRGRFRLDLLQDMLKFAVPLVVLNLAATALTSLDPYVIRAYAGLDQVAIYNTGFKVGMLLSLATVALQLAWPASLYQLARTPEGLRDIARFTRLAAVGVFGAALVVSAFARELMWVFGPRPYWGAYPITPWIAFGLAAGNLVYLLNANLHVPKKTYLIPVIYVAGAAAKTVALFVFVPPHGAVGAAWSTLIAFAVELVLAYHLSRRHLPVHYERGRIVAALIIAAVGAALALSAIELPYGWSLAARIVIIVAAGAGFRAAGAVTGAEVRMLRRVVGW